MELPDVPRAALAAGHHLGLRQAAVLALFLLETDASDASACGRPAPLRDAAALPASDAEKSAAPAPDAPELVAARSMPRARPVAAVEPDTPDGGRSGEQSFAAAGVQVLELLPSRESREFRKRPRAELSLPPPLQQEVQPQRRALVRPPELEAEPPAHAHDNRDAGQARKA